MSTDRDQDAYEILRRAGFTVDETRAVLRPGPEKREQRRYEIARDVMSGLMADPSFNPTDSTPHWCVEMADALLAELERTDGE